MQQVFVLSTDTSCPEKTQDELKISIYCSCILLFFSACGREWGFICKMPSSPILGTARAADLTYHYCTEGVTLQEKVGCGRRSSWLAVTHCHESNLTFFVPFFYLLPLKFFDVDGLSCSCHGPELPPKPILSKCGLSVQSAVVVVYPCRQPFTMVLGWNEPAYPSAATSACNS